MSDTQFNELIQEEATLHLQFLTLADLEEIRSALEVLTAELKPLSREGVEGAYMRDRWIRASALWKACDKIIAARSAQETP